MSSTEIITIKNDLSYKSKDIKKIAKTMWLGFYEKLDEYRYKTKIALWTITGASCVFDLNPISPKPNEYDAPPFIINTGIDSLYDLVSELGERLATNKVSDDEYLGSLENICADFDRWVGDAVVSVWNSKEIQRIHGESNYCASRFGVYSINEQDIAPNELHLMKHLAGDKIKR
ncbi:hypothetical protein [Gimesia sp.]|uniref:hypothetical protein n=1 Tax=Gimesia sp. TaxID=2024833 RepID=UPI003A929D4E